MFFSCSNGKFNYIEILSFMKIFKNVNQIYAKGYTYQCCQNILYFKYYNFILAKFKNYTLSILF